MPASEPASSDNATAPADETSNAAKSPTSPATPAAQPAFTPGAQTGPDLQPVVYNSFNQNQVKIDKNTGALDTTYPITLPPGRNNLQPDLDLVYNSEDSGQGSIFGEGWSISIPYIERLNLAGVENLYSTSTSDYFTSSIDGELATTTVVADYIARTENGTFDKYVFASSTDEWTMTDKNGTQYVFGSTSNSEQSDPNNSAHVFKWMLTTVTDTNGNNITYAYFKDSGQIYPSSTIYTGNGSSTGIFQVNFLRTANTDNATSSATGFAVNSNYRISEIDADVNGTWVRKYLLGYTTGDNGTTALLGFIAQSGENASGTVVSEPSSTFTYQVQTPGWTSSSTWNPPTPFVGNGGVDDGVRAADVNGDSLDDLVSGGGSWINDGAGWKSSSTWTAPVSFSTSGGDNGYRLVDVTGDGLADIISCNGSYINTGSGWVSSSSWNSPVCFASSSVSTGAIIADANGDGLPAILSGYTDASGTAHYAAYVDTGSRWATSTIWAPPIPFVASGGVDLGTRLADLTGDGLPDIISGYTNASGTNVYAAYLNTGDGWATSTVWNPPAPFVSSEGWDNGMRIADVNGDGLPDIISSYTDISGNPHYAAYLNDGHGWATSTVWAPPALALFDTDGGYDAGTRIADVLGDGLPAILSGYTTVSSTNEYAAWTNNNSIRADVLTGVIYPQGGNTSIAYQAAAQFMNASGTVANAEPYPVYVVSGITNNDGDGDLSTSAYQYASGTYYYASPTDHEFAGFGLVTETDAAGNVTKTYYDTGNGTNSAEGQYNDNFWKIGKAYRVENYDNAGHLYKVTVTKWDDTTLGSNAAYVFPDQTLEMDYDGLSTHDDSAESYAWNSANGNETQNIQWGQVTGSSTGSFATSSLGYATNYSYASSTSSNVLGKVSDETLLNQSSTKIEESQYYYDGLALGNVGAGNLTTQDDWISGSTYATTTRNTYNTYGLVTQTLDPRNNTTTYSYDAYDLYPATTTNALSQSTGYQYDYSTGKTTQTIDPNSLKFQTSYDGLGRPLAVLQPDQITTSTLDLKTAYTYTDSSGAVGVEEQDYLNGSTTVSTYSYYDGLDRLIQTRKSATDAGVYKVTDQAYNDLNLLAKESLPYFAGGSAQSAATTTAALFTTYTYDPLERVIDTVNAVGTVSDDYDNWKTTVTDANGNPKDLYRDAFRNLVQVGEHNGSSTYTTYYTYDGLRDLTNLTDANGNIRNFAYDGLGRMVSSTDLHASTDTTYGVWNYTYDHAGNLTTRVDPKNQTVDYTYDAVNRVLTEDYTGASTTAITYVYDDCTNGIGRLCTVSSTDAVSLDTKTYDPLGDLASETKDIGGTNYATSYTYDRQGNQLTITNPDGSEVEYTYGTGGLATSVQEKESGGSFNTIVSSLDYSPMDQIATQVDANGVTTENVYDPTRLYRLNEKITTSSSSDMDDLLGGGGRGGIHPLLSESCTGAETTYTVPAAVTQLDITAYGAQGGGSGGLGGEVGGTLSVTSGTTYYVDVGCQNGYDGGGSSGNSGQIGSGVENGGGMTWFSANDVFTTSTVLFAAGGGGGAGGQGDNEGVGGPGGGGSAGGTSGNNGGVGSSEFCDEDACAGGGGGGTPTAGGGGGGGGAGGAAGAPGTAGQGGSGGSFSGYNGAAGGGGGGGGYYGGGGGGGNGYIGGDGGSGGGGAGGSSYVASSSYLTNVSDVAAVNSGDGYLIITPVEPITSLGQYYANGTSTLNEGSSTNQGEVVFGGTLNSYATSTTLQLQVEVEPAGTSFTNVPNVTSSVSVAPGNFATSTFFGPNGSYHWQARTVDASNNTSFWQVFGPSPTSTDFILNSVVTESYTGSVGSITVPANVVRLSVTAYGAQGAGSCTNGGAGGDGGEVVGTLSVVPSSTYYFGVGGQNGYNGGGTGGSFNGGGYTWFSASSTYSTSTAIIVAGGGGGTGGCLGGSGNGGGSGGGGGGTSGGNGQTLISGGSSYPGGSGGSQTVAGAGGSETYCSGSAGSGSTGGSGNSGSNCDGFSAPGGGSGGGGYYGGGGGGAGWTAGGNNSGGGGGGGGSSYISSTLTSTSTSVGVNPGNGSLVITEVVNPVPTISSSSQYFSNGTSTLNEGSTTNQSTVVFGASLNSYTDRNVQLQVEVESAGTGFTNTPNVTSSPFVAPGNVVTTSFVGSNGSYHWQARANDAGNNTSTWKLFGPNGSSTDFVIAVPHVHFTFPTNGTTTLNFPDWELDADTVTSTDSYQLNVAWDDATGDPAQSSTIMASGTQLLSGVNVPKTVFSGDYTYDGTPVTMNATATLYDGANLTATTSVGFIEQTTVAPLGCGSAQIQCITYTYDNNGNITKVVDNSATAAAITVNYAYDGLNRLISASSTNAASGTNYLQTFTYDPVGNILTGPEGTYSYNASSGSNDTDPDAVTGITNGSSTTTFTYDNDGNLTNASSGFSYTWDYNNRLIEATSSGVTLTYGYDYTGQRVETANGSSTTYYPETTYNVNSSTITKSIFAGGVLVSTIVNATTTSGYQYYRSITVSTSTSIASGTLANFPMLVSSTLSSWASVAHGGHVQNLVTAPGGGQEPADLAFATSSANCNGTSLNFETESYVSSTGALADWVNVPTMATGTIIYACYGNSSVTTDQSHPSSTWNSNFTAVYHLANSSYIDSTANAHNGVAVGTITQTSTIIDGGIYATSTGNPYISVTSTAALNLSTASFTVSMWVDLAASQQNYGGFLTKGGSSNDWGFGENAGTGNLYWYQGGTGVGNFLNIASGYSALEGTGWNYITVTYNHNTTTTVYYLNGQNNTSGHVLAPTYVTSYPLKMTSSRDPLTSGGYFDEVDISDVLLSPQWILTEYNNQKSPATFYAVGAETASDGGSSGLTVSYIASDNLGGTNVVTNASGTVVETLDYYPYGQVRIDNTFGSSIPQQRKYIGQQYDSATQLSYLNARYYNGAQGQFISQDPMFLGDQSQQTLANPQSLSAYSYSEDNPITKSDPNGLQALLGLDDAAAFAIFTAPIWVPAVYDGVNALSTAVMGAFTDSWANSNSRQIQQPNINSQIGNGFLPDNKEPNNNDWKKWALIGVGVGVLGATVYQGYQEFASSIPSIFVGGPNSNTVVNLNQSNPTFSNPTSVRSPQQNNATSQDGSSSSGFSQQQLQSFQSQLNSIKAAVSQLIQEVDSLSKSKQ